MTTLHSSLPLLPSSSSSSSSSSSQSSSSSSFSLPNMPLIPPKPNKSLLHKHPLYAPTQSNLSLQIKEKIVCLEIMGIDSGKALAKNPSLHTTTLDSIQSTISFLRSKGIQQKDLKKIFGMCPKILTSDIAADLIPIFDFLAQDLQVPFHNLRKVINKCPRLLASSARDQLKPALFYLQRLGFRNLESLAENDAVLLVSSVEKTLIPKLRFLEERLEVSKEEAVGMVVRCPSLFTFSIENNLKPKLEYLVGEMERKVEEVKEFPQYFAFSLEKRIKPRHLEIVKRGLGKEMGLPLMLISTDHEFTQLINPNQ
ncbi:transcription termination factor MTEF1, chloroplastic [Cannabis sativa]|uniref:transcription termination factor MTEF1, chloroplastic n=1 Tax=Cannabis sativa TaxID=3483 RepID=UPI0029CA6921|nr:transcription termination factor MTEF1, chloroplastic [Cannabis sativa]